MLLVVSCMLCAVCGSLLCVGRYVLFVCLLFVVCCLGLRVDCRLLFVVFYVLCCLCVHRYRLFVVVLFCVYCCWLCDVRCLPLLVG